MAKITITIEAEGGEDLRSTLELLTNTTSIAYTIRRVEEDSGDVELDAGATQDAEPGERQRRPRRTKAEIAADNARAAAGGQTSSASATSAQTDSPDQTASTRLSTAKPSSGGATADVFGDQLKEVTSGALTLADVEAVGRQAFEKIGAAATQALLVEHGGGAKAFKAVEPQYFTPLHAALSAAAEG